MFDRPFIVFVAVQELVGRFAAFPHSGECEPGQIMLSHGHSTTRCSLTNIPGHGISGHGTAIIVARQSVHHMTLVSNIDRFTLCGSNPYTKQQYAAGG